MYFNIDNKNGDTPENQKPTGRDIVGAILTNLGRFIAYYALIPFIGSAVGLLFLFISSGFIFFVSPIVVFLIYRHLGRKSFSDMRAAAIINFAIITAIAVLLAVLMVTTEGSTGGTAEEVMIIACMPACFGNVLAMFGGAGMVAVAAISVYLVGFLTSAYYSDGIKWRRLIAPTLLIFASVVVSAFMYVNRAELRYAGHGFDYMNGYSSTDFTDYTVYSENSKLVKPGKATGFVIRDEKEMPKMDGAEACYPLYAAFAKAIYKDIDRIEKEFMADQSVPHYFNGKIVTFSNTLVGFNRLVDREIDMFFGARPSKSQMAYADASKVELEITPIGREAFVFFVEEDNPVDSLTSDQLRSIYHGDVDDWSELGGDKGAVVAFQRPENSGSQTMMEYFMGDVTLKEPKTYETVGGMGGVIREVAQYANEDGAIGYSFRYFVEELAQEKGVKLIAVDGVAPTVENVENGSYPLTVDLCLITRKDDPNPRVAQMRDFIISDVGQDMIRRTGYAALAKDD